MKEKCEELNRVYDLQYSRALMKNADFRRAETEKINLEKANFANTGSYTIHDKQLSHEDGAFGLVYMKHLSEKENAYLMSCRLKFIETLLECLEHPMERAEKVGGGLLSKDMIEVATTIEEHNPLLKRSFAEHYQQLYDALLETNRETTQGEMTHYTNRFETLAQAVPCEKELFDRMYFLLLVRNPAFRNEQKEKYGTNAFIEYVEREMEAANRNLTANTSLEKVVDGANQLMVKLQSGTALSEKDEDSLAKLANKLADAQDHNKSIEGVKDPALDSLSRESLQTLTQSSGTFWIWNSESYKAIGTALVNLSNSAHGVNGATAPAYERLYVALRNYLRAHDSVPTSPNGKKRFNEAAKLMATVGVQLAKKNPAKKDAIARDFKVQMLRSAVFRTACVQAVSDAAKALNNGSEELNYEAYAGLDEKQKGLAEFCAEVNHFATGVQDELVNNHGGMITGKCKTEREENALLERFAAADTASKEAVEAMQVYSQGASGRERALAAEIKKQKKECVKAIYEKDYEKNPEALIDDLSKVMFLNRAQKGIDRKGFMAVATELNEMDQTIEKIKPLVGMTLHNMPKQDQKEALENHMLEIAVEKLVVANYPTPEKRAQAEKDFEKLQAEKVVAKNPVAPVLK